MSISGRIVAAEGTPPLALKDWLDLCRSHPNLRPYPPTLIRNPFKLDELRPISCRSDTVMLVVADAEEGSLAWTQDEDERVVYVDIRRREMIPIVQRIAEALSSRFVEDGVRSDNAAGD